MGVERRKLSPRRVQLSMRPALYNLAAIQHVDQIGGRRCEPTRGEDVTDGYGRFQTAPDGYRSPRRVQKVKDG